MLGTKIYVLRYVETESILAICNVKIEIWSMMMDVMKTVKLRNVGYVKKTSNVVMISSSMESMLKISLSMKLREY